jgi:anti-sigma-K factor RskA
MNLRTPGRADALAAEYVLGTLRGRARQRFERLARSDLALGEAVRKWEERLVPLAEELPPLAPPARVWTAILARIRGTGRAPRGMASLWESVSLWRGLALAGLAAVIALAVVLLTPAPEGTMVVVLAAQDGKPMLVASADRGARYLTVKALTPVSVVADRSLQLWALPERAIRVRSARRGGRTCRRRADRSAGVRGSTLQNVPALAASPSPRGSPTGLPTGPVLYTARCNASISFG